jgi:hypothetical protein
LPNRLIAEFGGDPADFDQEAVIRLGDLGLARLLVDLLTRRMLYMHCLDEDGFRQAVVKAARTAGSSDDEERRGMGSSIDAAVDLLSGARDYFYPTDNYLLDLTLVAETTLGQPFRQCIGPETPPTNLLIGGHGVRPSGRN